MNLRWFVKVDGTKVLQQRGWDREKELWIEVPVVEEKRKGREFIIEKFDNRLGPYRAWPDGELLINYCGDKPDMSCMIKVREVIE